MGGNGGEWRRATEQRWRRRGRTGPTHRPPRYPMAPPKPTAVWRPAIPSWEKRYCSKVCKIPWGKICETQKVLPMYEKVAKWDASAGEEAFRNAKARFWAEINCLSCDIPLPDPNRYIDDVDYDAVIDPELVEDLIKLPPDEEGVKDTTPDWDSLLLEDIQATGWEDEDDRVPPIGNKAEFKTTIQETYGYYGNAPFYSGWNGAAASNYFNNVMNSGRGNAWGTSGGWWDRNLQENNRLSGRDHSWGNGWKNTWGNGKKIDRGGYFSSRHHYGGHQANNGWRNFRGQKKTNYTCGQSTHAKQPLPMQQNSYLPCGSMKKHRLPGSGGTWRWQRTVS